MSERICCEENCNRLGQHMGKRRKDGSVIRRARCAKHHSLRYGLKGWTINSIARTTVRIWTADWALLVLLLSLIQSGS